MAEIRVGKNETLETALRDLRDHALRTELLLKSVKENITKSLR